MALTGLNDNSVHGGGSSAGKEILVGRVTKVILGEFTKEGKIDPDFVAKGGWASVGSIKYNLIQTTTTSPIEVKSNNFALPLFGNIKQYPLKGEIVMLIAGPSTKMNDVSNAQQMYYVSSYNLWNSQHHNAFPDLGVYANYVAAKTSNQEKTAGAKITQGHSSNSIPLGDYFVEKSDVKPLLPFEGDIIVEGRNGQSIRLGSTVKEQKDYNTWSKGESSKTGDPITIITNRRKGKTFSPEAWIPGVEDINKDGSSIWMTSGQAVQIDVGKYPLDTFRLGVRAAYTADTTLPISDLSPGLQQIAAAEYDKRVIDNLA